MQPKLQTILQFPLSWSLPVFLWLKISPTLGYIPLISLTDIEEQKKRKNKIEIRKKKKKFFFLFNIFGPIIYAQLHEMAVID